MVVSLGLWGLAVPSEGPVAQHGPGVVVLPGPMDGAVGAAGVQGGVRLASAPGKVVEVRIPVLCREPRV